MCRLCGVVKCVEVPSKLIGTVDVVPPGLEFEPPTPDLACRCNDTVGVSPETDLEEVVRSLNCKHEGGNIGYCLGAKGGHPLALLADLP